MAFAWAVLTCESFENSGKDFWLRRLVALEADGERVCGELSSEECSDRPTTLDSRGPPAGGHPGPPPTSGLAGRVGRYIRLRGQSFVVLYWRLELITCL
jgi:hypothetical protein